MNINEKTLLLLMVVDESLHQNQWGIAEVKVESMGKYIPESDLQLIVNNLSGDNALEVVTHPPFDQQIPNEAKVYKLRPGKEFASALQKTKKLVEEATLRYLVDLQKEKLKDKETPKHWRWVDDLTYQANGPIHFRDKRNDRYKVFYRLVEAKGNWVPIPELIEVIKHKRKTDLRAVISQLNNLRCKGNGVRIEARRDPRLGAYKLTETNS